MKDSIMTGILWAGNWTQDLLNMKQKSWLL